MDVKALGLNIRRLRKDAGLTQEELAEKAKIANRALQRLEAGDGNPTIETLAAIAQAVGAPLTGLFNGGMMPAEALHAKGGKAGLDQLTKTKRNREAAQMLSAKGKVKASDEPAALDASGGAEILAKYQGLSPSLQSLACAVLYEEPAYLRQLEPGARQILLSLLEAFQKQLRSRA